MRRVHVLPNNLRILVSLGFAALWFGCGTSNEEINDNTGGSGGNARAQGGAAGAKPQGSGGNPGTGGVTQSGGSSASGGSTGGGSSGNAGGRAGASTGGNGGVGGSGGATGGVGGGTAGMGGAAGTPGAALGTVVLGASHCDGFLVCDGFEGASVDSTLWSGAGAGAQIGKDKFARGARALKLDSTAGSSVLALKKLPATLQEHLFGRMFLWSQDERPTYGNQGFYAHIEFFRVRRTNNYIGYAVGVVGDLRVTSPTDDAISIHEYVSKKWICVEWEFDTKNRKVLTWWNDGVKETTSDNSKSKSSNWGFSDGTVITETQLGIIPVTSGSTPLRVWIDEFALHTERIGCNR